MINVQTLGMLLRTLQAGEVPGRGAVPLQPLASAQAVQPISPEGAQSQRPGAFDTGRNEPGQRDAANPGATAAPRADATQPSRGAAGRPGAAGASTPTGASLSLSPTAQFVDTLLRLPGGRPIVPASPLVPAPGAAPEALARALQHSIVASGLFYESHLARWVGHRLPDSVLRQEPQAAWPVPPAATAASPAAAPAPSPDPDAPLPAASTPAATTPPAPTGTSAADAAPALVRAQLDVLETGQILWRGDLWHGQPATIEVREEDTGRDSTTLPAWHTRLAVTLPGLGAIEARMALAGTRLHVTLVAADEARATPLAAALPELAAALAARGLDVAPIRVDHGRAR